MNINKELFLSYARNLLGQVLTAIAIVSSTSGITAPINFHAHEWGLVANALWGSLVPVILRFVNSKDAAFGIVAKDVTDAVTAKVTQATK
jgi:hypothetical protein